MSRLRAAVIGVGYLGRFHAQKIAALEGVDLVGVCDFSPEQAQKVADELKTKAFSTASELLGHVDYVHIAASTQSHYDLAKLFLENKVPVLVEKPIAASVQQAQELCELSEKKSTLLSVGHIERFNPAFQFLKQQATQIRYLEINRLAPFRVRGSDVSVLHDLTIHDIDLVRWIFNRDFDSFDIASVKMIRPTIDDVSIRLKYQNGLQVTLNNSRLTPQIIRNYRAVGEQGSIFVNTATLEAEILTQAENENMHSVEKIQLGKVDALALEAEHFMQAVLGKKAPAITAQEALLALKNVETFVQAANSQIGGHS